MIGLTENQVPQSSQLPHQNEHFVGIPLCSQTSDPSHHVELGIALDPGYPRPPRKTSLALEVTSQQVCIQYLHNQKA